MTTKPALEFADAARTALGDNLVAVVLVGSFARGDQSASSDLDLCVLARHVDTSVLQSVGRIVASISTANEINPAVLSIDELRAQPDFFGIHKLRHEGIFLFGELPATIVPVESELGLAKRIASEVLMSSRHYLSAAEPAHKFMSGKLRVWGLKPLSFALRYYHFHLTGRYIRRYSELAEYYPLLALDPAADHQLIIQGCIDACEDILRT